MQMAIYLQANAYLQVNEIYLQVSASHLQISAIYLQVSTSHLQVSATYMQVSLNTKVFSFFFFRQVKKDWNWWPLLQ